MKQSLLLFIVTLSLFAKESGYLHELSFLMGNSENGSSSNLERSLAYQLQYQYNGLTFPVRPEFSLVYSQDIPLYSYPEKTRYVTAMANAVYEIAYSSDLTPYVKAGVGYTDFSNEQGAPASSPIFDTAAGLKLHLNNRFSLKLQALYTQGKDNGNILATAGLSYAFGKKEAENVPDSLKESVPPQESTTNVITEKEPETLPVQEVIAVNIPREVPSPLNIVFPFAAARLTENAKASIKAYAAELNLEGNRERKILIVGHTDGKGSRAFNATLSMKRASAVYAALITNGIDPRRISIDGYGETMPVADNETERGREQNRRVSVSVTDE
jgi:outer membrane protein OmpA-like peptidoglycan-associated protein